MAEPAASDAEEIDRRLREHLSGRADVAFAYLYGSRAKGTADEESDVDVAVHFGADAHREAGERAGPGGRPGTVGRRKAALELEGALEREDLLDDDLARRLGEMAGFRNVLAHEYASVVPELVHEHLTRLDDVRAYVEALTPELRERDALS